MTLAVATTAPPFKISESKSMLYHSAPDPFTCSAGFGGTTRLGLSRISNFCGWEGEEGRRDGEREEGGKEGGREGGREEGREAMSAY